MVRIANEYEVPESPKRLWRRVVHHLKQKMGRHLTLEELKKAQERVIERVKDFDANNRNWWREKEYFIQDGRVIVILRGMRHIATDSSPAVMFIKQWEYSRDGKLLSIHELNARDLMNEKTKFEPPGSLFGKVKYWHNSESEPNDKPPKKWFRRKPKR